MNWIAKVASVAGTALIGVLALGVGVLMILITGVKTLVDAIQRHFGRNY